VRVLMLPAHASAPAINPWKQTCGVETMKRWQRSPVVVRPAVGEARGCCGGPWQPHISRCSTHSKTCTPCFHNSRTLFSQPECCYQMFMVCAMTARLVLENSVCGNSGRNCTNSHRGMVQLLKTKQNKSLSRVTSPGS
jgi:hypothetical protein